MYFAIEGKGIAFKGNNFYVSIDSSPYVSVRGHGELKRIETGK